MNMIAAPKRSNISRSAAIPSVPAGPGERVAAPCLRITAKQLRAGAVEIEGLDRKSWSRPAP